MYPNGQIMVNCGGIDLSVGTAQKVDGIYENLLSAYYSDKPVMLTNCFYGDYSITPIPVLLHLNSDGHIVINVAIYQITVTDADAATVVDLTA